MTPTDSTPKERLVALDQFRGLAILLMLLANYMEHIRAVPPFLKHAPDLGLTIIDFIAPAFLFAVGIGFGASVLRRRNRDGLGKTTQHVATRAMALVGIGALFTVGEHSYGFGAGLAPWGVLQAIGVSILLTYPTLYLPTLARLGVALALVFGYQALLDAFWLETVVRSSHAGIQGSLSWTSVLLFATVYSDLFHGKNRRAYLLLALAMLAAGLALCGPFPVSKHRMSVSFVFIVTASAALVFAGMDAVARRRERALAFLGVWGTNPLVLYISQLFLLGAFLVPAAPWWHTAGPIWLAVVQGAIYLGILYAWGAWLHRKRVYISL
ncbi:MAG: DUF1624 domain-containing protein [Spirochaetes bacterium]|nr:DUF1624 domain-containing protein [Spirochaetota bacterium]